MFAKLLVPLDGSELAEKALPHAGELAQKLGSEVVLLRVAPSVEQYQELALLRNVEEDLRHSRAEAERYLADLEPPLSRAGVKVSSIVLLGDPARSIIDFANDASVSLIVMSTHGRSGLGRWVMGSVADKVVRSSGKPVLLCRHQP